MFAAFQSHTCQGSMSLSCVMVRGIRQKSQELPVRQIISHSACGWWFIFFHAVVFLWCLFFYSFFVCLFLIGRFILFICAAQSLMHFNLYDIMWEKSKVKSYVHLFINMLLSTALCQGRSIQDALIDSPVQAHTSHLWIPPPVNSTAIYLRISTESICNIINWDTRGL